MDNLIKTISVHNTPEWLNTWIYSFGGFFTKNVTVEQIQQSKLCELLIYESDFLKNRQQFYDFLDNGNIAKLVVFNDHPWKFTNEILTEIDNSKQVNNIYIFCQGEWENRDKYTKLISFHSHLQEHVLSHYFMYLLSTQLKQRRNPTKDFIFYVSPKDQYRKNIIDMLATTDIFKNSLTATNSDSGKLYTMAEKKIQDWIERYGNHHNISSLRAYGNGLPDFSAYENAFCEIVLESQNTGSWHFSEKLFRPISQNVPIVFLAGKHIYERALDYGYEFYDYDNFYENWHKDVPLAEKSQILKQFLNHIKIDRPYAEMTKVANNNYEHFWNHRKIQYYEDVQNILHYIFGDDSIIKKIYKELNQ
jgi:hypothetical protein